MRNLEKEEYKVGQIVFWNNQRTWIDKILYPGKPNEAICLDMHYRSRDPEEYWIGTHTIVFRNVGNNEQYRKLDELFIDPTLKYQDINDIENLLDEHQIKLQNERIG